MKTQPLLTWLCLASPPWIHFFVVLSSRLCVCMWKELVQNIRNNRLNRCEIVKLHFRCFLCSFPSLVHFFVAVFLFHSIRFHTKEISMLLLYGFFVCYSEINIQCSHRICIKKIPLNRIAFSPKKKSQPRSNTIKKNSARETITMTVSTKVAMPYDDYSILPIPKET